jgi:hypothetical protein
VSDIEPRLEKLKSLKIPGEVLIISDKLALEKTKTFNINAWIKVTLVSFNSRSRAVKVNHLLRIAEGELIILHADDFEIKASVIKAHLDFHLHDDSIKSIYFGMSWIKHKTVFNAWLENQGTLFGYRFEENAPYEKMQFDFFYGGNTSIKAELFKLTGLLNESCEFDCTDDWLLWREMKTHGCEFFHLPKCDVVHFHDVTIKERFISLIQSGWNAAHLKLNENYLDHDCDTKIQQIHQEFINASKKLTRPKELFLLVEEVGPQIGGLLYEDKIELNDMYSPSKIFENIFSSRNLSLPDFDNIENNIRKSGPINLFRLYGSDGLYHLKKYLLNKISYFFKVIY